MTSLSINIAPSAEGQQAMRKLFAQSISTYAAEITRAERLAVAARDGENEDLMREAMDLLINERSQSIDALQDAINEIDRVASANAAIREAGY